jgi:hypothetical protein
MIFCKEVQLLAKILTLYISKKFSVICTQVTQPIGLFTVVTYWLLIRQLISHLFMFYCQMYNK